MIKEKVDINENTRINATSPKKLTFFINGNKEFNIKADNVELIANVYAPTGKLTLHGNGEGTIISGWHIVEKLHANAKDVTWISNACVQSARGPVSQTESKFIPTASYQGNFKVAIHPNPSSHEFRLQLSGITNEPIKIKVYDVSGKLLLTSTYSSNAYIFLGAQLLQGTYFAEVEQGQQKQTVKLIKAN